MDASPIPDAKSTACRVLIVDDNRDGADSMGWLLGLIGFRVQVCYDGFDALVAAATFSPHICLIDLNMPRMSGFELAAKLREQAAGRVIFLIALTAMGSPESFRRTADSGFDLHLVKPVEPTRLIELLVTKCRQFLGLI